nr:MAG TPA: hypothetical protein [Caudoviricetes sp.]
MHRLLARNETLWYNKVEINSTKMMVNQQRYIKRMRFTDAFVP